MSDEPARPPTSRRSVVPSLPSLMSNLASIRIRSLLLHGDTLVLDRWLWLEKRLPAPPARIADAGCGNGWLALNCDSAGFETLGLGWDDSDMRKAQERSAALRSQQGSRFKTSVTSLSGATCSRSSM